MKIHRFIIPFGHLEQGDSLSIDDPRVVHQVMRVLRFTTGGLIAICDGHNQEAYLRIQSIDNQKIIRGTIEAVHTLEFNLRETILYCSLIKKDNFELVVQKATEIGVSAIVPIVTKRVVKLGLRYDRLQTIVLEASEQSGRGSMPSVQEALDFMDAVNDAKEQNQQNILFDGSGTELKGDNEYMNKVGIFIGPEGGFDEQEVKIAQDEGFNISSLGPLTLRAETAAIVSSYMISNNRS